MFYNSKKIMNMKKLYLFKSCKKWVLLFLIASFLSGFGVFAIFPGNFLETKFTPVATPF